MHAIMHALYCVRCSSPRHGAALPRKNCNSEQSATRVETSVEAGRRQVQSECIDHRLFQWQIGTFTARLVLND